MITPHKTARVRFTSSASGLTLRIKYLLVTITVVSGAACVRPSDARASTIAQVETLASGTPATLDQKPVITYIASQPGTGDGYTYTNYAILANDGTGSIDIFGHLPTGSTYVPTVGDAITVSGTYSPFNSIPELASLTAISQVSSGNAVPGPKSVTIPQMLALASSQNYAIQEYLLDLHNVTFVAPPATYPIHANQSLTATDGTNSLTVFFNPSSYSVSDPLAGTAIPTGPVDIVGIASVFGTTAELLPFTVTPLVPEPASLTLGWIALGVVALLRRRRVV
jgi:uncharacterized protein (TIGR03382 family)